MKITAYAKYGCKIFGRYKLMCAIIIIQLTAVLCALNIAIGNYNSRNMLYVPFEDILSKDGYYIMYDSIFSDTSDTSVENDNTEENGSDRISGNAVFDRIFPQLKGDISYTEILSAQAAVKRGNVSLIVLDDDIYNALELPVADGSYSQAVMTLNSKYTVGDIITIGNTDIKISGVLTSNTYIPKMSRYIEDMTVADIYDEYKSEVGVEGERTPTVIAPLSLIENDSALLSRLERNEFKFLYYNTAPTDEERAYNDKLIHSESGLFMPLNELNERSKTYVNDNLKKIFPVAVCVGVIALFGIVCCVSIINVLCAKTNAIFYSCGADRKDCIFISLSVIMTIELISVIILLLVMKLISISGFENSLGVVILANNYIVNLLIYAVMLFIGTIIILCTFFKNQPVQVLKKRSI